MNDIKILERFKVARQMDKDEHKSGEQNKIGNLRAGSSGILTEQGEVAGSCLRKSHLRSLGIELEEISDDKYIMFELGYANEDEIYRKLNKAKQPNEIILREEEIPIEWTTTKGVKVTGRPDIVICAGPTMDPEDPTPLDVVAYNSPKPILGLELKSVHSMWTARDVFFGAKPKLANMVQAAHYMWKLNVPYKLIYTSYSQLGQGMAGADSWVAKQFPKMGQQGSHGVEYNEKKGTIKHIKQFEVAYDLKLDKFGRVHYKLEQEDNWTASIVTTKDIERYFEHAAMIGSGGDLGPRPSAVDTLGNKANYSDCDYCPLKLVCDKSDKDKSEDKYVHWFTDVMDFLRNR